MPDSPSDIHVEPADRPSAESGRPWLSIVTIAVLAAVVLVFAVPVAFTATPSRCASCHEMKPYYDSWRTSSHRAAAPNCLYCHAKPGVLNVVGFELGFYRMLAGHFSGSSVSTTQADAPSVASCSRKTCHSLNRETSTAGDLKIDHSLHVTKAGIACARCHPGAVHTGVGGRQKLPRMQLCKECHADKMKQCNYCHNSQRLQAAPGGH